ncbi:MAG: hypothetical protein ABSB96_05275 [Gaiellaceae bacterium]
MSRPDQRSASGSYASALDLPSVVELLDQIQGMKTLTRFIARDQRKSVLEIEAQVRELMELVDRFYELLGPRHWIFHESLNTEKVKPLIDLPADKAEQGLIKLYQDPDALRFMIMGLRRFPQMRSRMDLVDKARIDYEAGRFYSTALVLLTVMDGFVNDLDTSRRRGLHTREAEELAAWDSIVGHHQGLTHAHKTFTKGTSKTSDEPVYELHRHGIIHGMLVNYDNAIVATKAWNRLFTVGDWAASLEKRKVEPKPDPSWREVLSQIAANERAKKALDAWRPSSIKASDPKFLEQDVCQRALAYLEAWVAKNYGKMASLISPRLTESTLKKTAGMVREGCSLHDLQKFEFKRASFEAAAVCEIDVDLTFDAGPQPARMRWIRETADGTPATPDVEAEWFLFLWGPWAMLSRD